MATTFGQIQDFCPEIELYFEAKNYGGRSASCSIPQCDWREELYLFVQLLVSIEGQCQYIG